MTVRRGFAVPGEGSQADRVQTVRVPEWNNQGVPHLAVVPLDVPLAGLPIVDPGVLPVHLPADLPALP